MNRIPVLIASECRVALRIVACRVAASMTMDGRSTEEIVTSLETLALDQHIQRGSGIPSERWSVASGLTIHVPNKSKRNTKEKHSDS